MNITAMKQALEALELWLNRKLDEDTAWQAHTALRQAIEQAEKQEPVAWKTDDIELYVREDKFGFYNIPLYTTPQPQREWVGLTDEERNHARQTITYSQLAMTAGEWTEAVQIETERRLKEKNT